MCNIYIFLNLMCVLCRVLRAVYFILLFSVFLSSDRPIVQCANISNPQMYFNNATAIAICY